MSESVQCFVKTVLCQNLCHQLIGDPDEPEEVRIAADPAQRILVVQCAMQCQGIA